MTYYLAKYKSLPSIVVQANSTTEAGYVAAKRWLDENGVVVDPFTVDLVPQSSSGPELEDFNWIMTDITWTDL